jgi:molybdopterin molybdotransferase
MIFKTDSYDSVNSAFTKLFQHIKPHLEMEYIPVFNSKGYTLKNDIISSNDIPFYSSSHMDGFALKSEDTINASDSTPILFKVSNRKSVLGFPSNYKLKTGEAYRIQTGGYLPDESDAIVPIESIKYVNSKTINVFSPVKKKAFVSLAGSDIEKGKKVLFKGQILRAQEMALLAYMQVSKVPVFRKSVVAIIPTGSELTDEIGENKKNKAQKIVNTNSHVLSCIIDEIGGIPFDLGVTPDKPEILEKKIKIALIKSDILITIGGSSIGTHDIVERTINSFGKPGVLVHGVKLDRGRVSGLAVIDRKPIIISPGPIQGTLNAFIVFVRPLIRIYSGQTEKNDSTILATITENWHARNKFLDFTNIVYVKVSKYNGEFFATPQIGETQKISLLTSSNAYIIIPEDVINMNAGEKVEVNLLPGFSYIKDSYIPDRDKNK